MLTSSQKIIVSLKKSLRKSFLFNSIKSITKKSFIKKSFIFKAIKSTFSYNIYKNSLIDIFDDNKNKKKLIK